MSLGNGKGKPALILAACCLLLFPGLLAIAAQNEGDEAAEFGRAQAAQKQGDFKSAEQIYLKLLTHDPDLFPAQFGLGANYYLERNYEKSNTYLLKALQKQPDMFPALSLVGSNFLKLGEPEQAVPYLKRAVRVQPADEYANHNLANAEFLAGDYQAAYADYVRFLHVAGRHDDAISWYGLGEISLLLSREVSGQLGDVPTTDPARLRFLSSVYEELEEWGLAASRLKMLESQPSWSLWAKLHLGQVYLHMPDPPHAIEKFQQVLASDPDSAEARFGVGVCLLLQGKQETALPELVTAARRDPWLFSHPESIQQIASASHVTIAPETGASGNALVDAFIGQLVSPGTDSNSAQSKSFVALLRTACAERHKENEKKVDAALRPGTPSKARLSLAEGLLEEGDNAGASDLLRKSAPSAQSDRDLYAILEAKLALADGNTLDAAQAMLPLLRSKQPPENVLTISTLLQQAGKQAMGEVIRISPDSANAHLLQAQIEDARHHTAQAISEYQQAVQAAPDDSTTHFKLGDYLWQVGKFEEAIVALQHGVNLDRHNAAAYYQLGDCYVNLAEPQKALPFLKEAVGLDPTLDAAYKDLGKIYYDQGNFDDSIQVLKKVVARDSDGSVNYLLFRDYSRLKNAPEAAACMAKFQELKKAHTNKELFNAELAQSQGKNPGESTPAPSASDAPPADQPGGQKPN
jgi:tetratricopeptide (TPR) repeat protein